METGGKPLSCEPHRSACTNGSNNKRRADVWATFSFLAAGLGEPWPGSRLRGFPQHPGFTAADYGADSRLPPSQCSGSGHGLTMN